MFLTRLRGITAITVVVLALLARLSVEARTRDLFTPVDEPSPPAIASDDLTLHSRMVTMDLGQVQREVRALRAAA